MTIRYLPLVLIALATPAAAQQQSASYKFLEAVRKADGNTVNQMLGEPGQHVIDARDRATGETALHIVAKRGDALYTRVLLSNGADPNVRDPRGATPLLVAVDAGASEVVAALIARRANVDLGNSAGETPLIHAVQLRNLELVRTLLAAGANPDATDNVAGLSARDYARRDTRSPAILKTITETKAVTRRAVAGPKL